jgi:hypothetical protein
MHEVVQTLAMPYESLASRLIHFKQFLFSDCLSLSKGFRDGHIATAQP